MDVLIWFKKYILAALDVIVVIIAYVGTNVFLGQPFVFTNAANVLYLSVITYLLVFLTFGIYHNLVSFSGIREYAICFLACMVSGLLVCMERLLFHIDGINRQIFLASVFAGVLCVGVRVVARLCHRNPFVGRRKGGQAAKRLLIIGAGETGNMFIRELMNSGSSGYEVVGFIDDNPAKIGRKIYGIKVLGSRASIRQACKSKKVDTILFAIPSASGDACKEILDICSATGCHVRILPGIQELISDKDMIGHRWNINIADLLYRDPIRLNNNSIGNLIENRVVLVTGGGGSIGSELCRQIARFNPAQLLILDIYENNAYDIQQELRGLYPELNQRVIIASARDRARLEEIFSAYRPSLVFHAAAHKHVPLMEDDPREAVKNNVFGTLNVAECADRYHADKFVLISTDKAVNPTNVMGATKRICEMLIQNLDKQSKTEYAAVRFGNVLGSNGSVIPLFQRQIASGGPVTVTHKEITRFFMTITEAAQLVLQAATYAAGGEIFVLDMGEPVKIYDLAENLTKLSGFKPGRDIAIEVTGLRPGEKLYEELMMEEEGLKATQNEKIFITRPLEFDSEAVQAGLSKLREVVGQTDDFAVKQVIAQMVTTYSIDLQEHARQADFQERPDIVTCPCAPEDEKAFWHTASTPEGR